MSVHRCRGTAILEFEPVDQDAVVPLETAHLLTIDGEDRLYRDTARMVRVTLGRDRVIIYKMGFDEADRLTIPIFQDYLNAESILSAQRERG